MKKTEREQIKELLMPYVREYELKKDTVTKEDVEALLRSAKSFQVEKKFLQYIKAHPDDAFWELLAFFDTINALVPLGQEDILDDMGDDDED